MQKKRVPPPIRYRIGGGYSSKFEFENHLSWNELTEGNTLALTFCNFSHIQNNGGDILQVRTLVLSKNNRLRLRPLFWTFWTYSAPIFRKSKSCALRSVIHHCFKGRWKVPTLAHKTVSQTSKSDSLEPICWVLKLPDCHKIGFGIGKIVDKKLFFFCGNADISNVIRSASVGFWCLTHRWMRQGLYFSAHFE